MEGDRNGDGEEPKATKLKTTTADLGLVEGLDELGGGGGLLAGGLGEDELDLGQHLGLPDIHGGRSEARGAIRQAGRVKDRTATAAQAKQLASSMTMSGYRSYVRWTRLLWQC